jgi:hypothetical protein
VQEGAVVLVLGVLEMVLLLGVQEIVLLVVLPATESSAARIPLLKVTYAKNK